MAEILRQGPSFPMIAMACNMDLKEVETTIKSNPTLKNAYNMAVANVALAIRELNGNKSRIAKRFDVQRHIVEHWVQANRRLQTECRNAEEKFVDIAESAILKAARQGKDWAVLHILETKGEPRGWAKKRSIDLRAYAQATDTDVRLILQDVVGAIATGAIEGSTVEDE